MLETELRSDKRQVGTSLVQAQSNGYARVTSPDITPGMLGNRPTLVAELDRIKRNKSLEEEHLRGVMFSTQIGSAPAKYSPTLCKEGETFLGMSDIGSSRSSIGAMELSRSAFTALGEGKGYLQRKPCGMRNFALPFKLTVPFQDPENNIEFSHDTDLTQMYLEEKRSGVMGPVNRHLANYWSVYNGMLASAAEAELTNGVRFAQLYKRVWEEYPTGQIPVKAHRIDSIIMPDLDVRPVTDLLVDQLQRQPLQFETMKVRLLDSEHKRLTAQGKSVSATTRNLEKMNADLDQEPIEKVVHMFLAEDPFVQTTCHVPSFARLSFKDILANSDRYATFKAFANSVGSNGAELFVLMCMHESIIEELIEAAGHHRSEIRYTHMEPYKKRVLLGADYQAVFEDWRRAIGRINKFLFTDVAQSEVGKMSKSTATTNAIGVALDNPVWRSNMIGGSPCDWDHLGHGMPDILPQANEESNFDADNYRQGLATQQFRIDGDIEYLGYLLGIENEEEKNYFKSLYRAAYGRDVRKAREVLVESDQSDLDTSLRSKLLSVKVG